MKKVPVWKGNDIGHGIRGGVLSVGAHEIKVGQEVPIDLLAKDAVKSLRDKGAIVDDVPDNQKEAPKKAELNDEGSEAMQIVKDAKSELAKAKKLVAASKKAVTAAEKSAEKQKDVLGKMADGDEGRNKAEDVLQEFMSGVETSQANSEAAVKAVEDAEEALGNAEELLAETND